MKQSLITVLAVLATSIPGPMIFAQDSAALKHELNQEIDLLLPKVKLHKKARSHSQGIVLAQNASPSAAAAAVAPSQATSTNTNSNGNANDTAANAGSSTNVTVQVTDTPAQTVEATPLKESKLDKLKKDRLDMERTTEEKLVEKLESDRVAREQKRSAKTDTISFDDEKKAEAEMNKLVDTQQTQVKIKEVEVVQPQETIIVPAAKSEPAPRLEAELPKEEPKKEERQSWYVGGNAGMSDYSAQNIKGVYAAGILLGVILPERIILEGNMLFSTYDITNPAFGGFGQPIQMDQRNYTIGAKYQFTNTRIRPSAGVLVGYTTRTFTFPNTTFPSSQAYDAGVTVGADIAVSENFSIGAELRYFMNLSSRRDNSGYMYNPSSGPYGLLSDGKNVEDINYYVLGVSGIIRF